MKKNKWHDINSPGYFLTDEMDSGEPAQIEQEEAPQPRPQASFSSPRWYHNDPQRKQESPDMAAVGDDITMEIKSANIVDGAGIDILVQDHASKSAWQTKRVFHSRVKNNLLSAGWKIDRKQHDSDQPDFRFQADYKGYSGTAKCPPTPIMVAGKIICDFAEIPDVHFNTDSPLPVLDENGGLAESLASALKFAKENSLKEIVVFGHTDTRGDMAHNYDISKWRAEAVKALLDNDKSAWVNFADTQAGTDDQQAILSSLTKRYGWNCDPGAIDGKDGPATKSARESFQKQYNEKYKGSLKADGVFGEKSWGAVFEVLIKIVEEEFKKLCGEGPFPKLTYGYNGKGVYPCGESFPIDNAEKDNYASKENRRVEIMFFDQGKCPVLKDCSAKKAEKITVKENPVHDSSTKKKAIPVKKTAAQSGDIKDTDSIFYLPGENKYFVVDPADIDSVIEEVKFTQAFADKVAVTRQKMASNPDGEAVLKAARELEKEAKEKFEELDDDPGEAIEELVAFKVAGKWGNMKRFGYIRKYKRKNGVVKGHLRSDTDEVIRKKMKEILEPEEEKEKLRKKLTPVMNAALWQSGEFDKQWPDIWKYKGKNSAKAESTENKFVDASVEAQWLRFTAGAAVDGEIDWKEKKLSISAHGDIAYDAVRGKAELNLHLPCKSGVDIFDILGLNEKGLKVVRKGKVCSLRFKMTGEAEAYIGASLSGALALPDIDFSRKEKAKTAKTKTAGQSATLGAGASGFAGGSAGIAGKFAFEWSADRADFKTLGEAEVGASARGGIGGELKFKMGYIDGKFRIEMAASAVLGVGAKGDTSFEVGIEPALDFLIHVFNSVDYHYIISIDKSAFDAFKALMYARMIKGYHIAENSAKKAVHELADFGSWLAGQTEAKILEYKNTSIYNMINTNVRQLMASPPESLGMTLQTLMKVPEERDFDAILKILRNTQTEHELKWIIRNAQTETPIVKDMDDSAKGRALRDGIMRLRTFGDNYRDLNKMRVYRNNLDLLLQKKGIRDV